MMYHYIPRLLGCLLIVVSMAACESILPSPTSSAPPTPSYSLGSLRLGDSVIRQRTNPYRVRNCQGTNNPLRVSSGYSLSNAVEWRVGSRAGVGVQIGNDAIPVNISLETALDGQIAAQVTSSGNGETELTLSGSPNAIVEYEIHWFETWQSATIPLIPPIGDAIPIEVTYLTNLQPEIANETVIECPNSPQTLQSPTQILPARTEVVPAATSISALMCLSFDDLSALGNVLQVLESPPGVLAGAQIAFMQSWNAPDGWIIHRNSQQVQSVGAGDIASIWSPEACRPLQRRSESVVETYCYGECWEYDLNARTMRWTGYTDGREDVWQPQGTPLESVRAGYTVIFGPMLVPGEIFACRLVIDGEVRKNACDGVNVFVPADVELRVISDGNVGGFRWCPREGYGYRADRSYQCR